RGQRRKSRPVAGGRRLGFLAVEAKSEPPAREPDFLPGADLALGRDPERARARVAIVALQAWVVVLVVFEPCLWVVTILVVKFQSRRARRDEAGDLRPVSVFFLLLVFSLRRRRVVDVAIDECAVAAVRLESDRVVFLPALAVEMDGIKALDLGARQELLAI